MSASLWLGETSLTCARLVMRSRALFCALLSSFSRQDLWTAEARDSIDTSMQRGWYVCVQVPA